MPAIAGPQINFIGLSGILLQKRLAFTALPLANTIAVESMYCRKADLVECVKACAAKAALCTDHGTSVLRGNVVEEKADNKRRASQSKTGRLFFVYASGGTGRHEDHRRQAAYRRRHSPGVTPYSFLNAFENEACDWNPQRPAITSRLVCRSTRSRRAAIAIRSCESQACGVR